MRIDTLKRYYDERYEKISFIKQVLINNFGEENVDFNFESFETVKEANKEYLENGNPPIYFSKIREYTIIVHFPEVRVSNEDDQFIDIQDLWAKIVVDRDGRLVNLFQLTRTTFPISHLRHDYAHSHINGIPRAGQWLNPCLGTGPLNQTQSSLCAAYDKDLWELFAVELGIYVTVESIRGVPYRHLSYVTSSTWRMEGVNLLCMGRRIVLPRLFTDNNKILLGFVQYLLTNNVFKLQYVGYWDFKESNVEFYKKVSDHFIKYFNEGKFSTSVLELFRRTGILMYGKVIDNQVVKFSRGRSYSDSFDLQEGQLALRFKNQDVRIHIINDNDTNLPENAVTLLDVSWVAFVHDYILFLANYAASGNSLLDNITKTYLYGGAELKII